MAAACPPTPANWPWVDILLRGDKHYATPEVLSWRRDTRVDFIPGLPQTKTLRRHGYPRRPHAPSA